MSSEQSAGQVKQTFIARFPEASGELAHWLWSDIAHLHMNWSNYLQLFGTDQDTVELLSTIASSYFSMTERVLRQDTLMRICRITDPSFSDRAQKKPNASMRQLLLQTSETLPAELRTEVESSLDVLDGLSGPIRDLRNKRFAHSDIDEVLQLKTEPLPGISPQQVEDVLARIRDTYALLEGHFLHSTTALGHVIQTNDARKLIHHLKRVVAYQDIEKIVLGGRFGCGR